MAFAPLSAGGTGVEAGGRAGRGGGRTDGASESQGGAAAVCRSGARDGNRLEDK